MTDQRLLFTTAFVRAVATGMVGVLLGIYLAQLGLSAKTIYYVVGAGLAGAAIGSLVAIWFADRRGRKRLLVELSLLGTAGAAVVATASDALVVGLATFVGMLNGSGRDRGAALILDQAILPSVTGHADRTRAFAVYNAWQDAGHAVGALLAGLPSLVEHYLQAPTIMSHRIAFGSCALLLAATAVAYLRLSPAVEPDRPGRPIRVSPPTRRLLWKSSALFALDSLGSGFLTAALLSFFFFERFHVTAGTIGILFFLGRVANAASHFAAARLARRIGLVNTMVFTHIPANLILVGVVVAPGFPAAALLFLLREMLVEMDVSPRQSYLMAVVRPGERTMVSGVTHLVRMTGMAVTPFIAGLLMPGTAPLAAPFFLVGAGMKVTYDVALYFSFRHVKPPEEVPAHGEHAA